jgi:hypothetical protein
VKLQGHCIWCAEGQGVWGQQSLEMRSLCLEGSWCFSRRRQEVSVCLSPPHHLQSPSYSGFFYGPKTQGGIGFTQMPQKGLATREGERNKPGSNVWWPKCAW